MRIRGFYTIILLCGLVASSVAGLNYLPDYLSTKMNRHVVKTFGKEVRTVQIQLPDSLSFDHQLYSIHKSDSCIGYSLLTRALGCNIGGCDKPTKGEGFEQFYFMTAFDCKANIVKVRVLEYTSNHGYQIANKGWLKQFQKGRSFKVDDNIDGISGATVSVKSITRQVNKQVHIIEQYLSDSIAVSQK